MSIGEQATQTVADARLAIITGTKPWENDIIFAQWVEWFAENIRIEAHLIAIEEGKTEKQIENQNAMLRHATRMVITDYYESEGGA